MNSREISPTVISGPAVTGGAVIISRTAWLRRAMAMQPLVVRQWAMMRRKVAGCSSPIRARKSFSEITPTILPSPSTTGAPE